MKKWQESIYPIVVIGGLFVAGVSLLVFPEKDFSELENRYLTKFPEWTIEKIGSGESQKKLENAATDQFPFRQDWIKLATGWKKSLGRTCINGVYLGKQDYYFEQVLDSQISEKQYELNLAILEAFKEQVSGPFTVMLVPSPGKVLEDYLPEQGVLYEDETWIQREQEVLGDSSVNIKPLLQAEAKKGQVYFRTDHHWTLYGAFLGYRSYYEHMGKTYEEYNEFSPQLVRNDFLGTLYSKVLERKPKKDLFYLLEDIPQSIKVTIDDRETETIYEMDKLKQKDKYGVYFGGNHGYVKIENQEATSEDTLLLLKDSFAHSMTPFLMRDYKTILLVDLRYYNESVFDLLQQYPKAEVLVLYERSNFAKEENLRKLMVAVHR